MATIVDKCVELIYEIGFYDYSNYMRILGMFFEMALVVAVMAVPFIVVIGIIKFITRLGRYDY